MRVNIYIRKENEKRWLDIEDKSAWVNERLNPAFKGINRAVASAIKFEDDTYMRRSKDAVTNDKLAVDAFNDNLTCKYGHYSKDGKSCNNIKCAYFDV